MNEQFGAHGLLRTCAKLCRKNGENIEQIKFLLGHSLIQITNFGRSMCELLDREVVFKILFSPGRRLGFVGELADALFDEIREIGNGDMAVATASGALLQSLEHSLREDAVRSGLACHFSTR